MVLLIKPTLAYSGFCSRTAVPQPVSIGAPPPRHSPPPSLHLLHSPLTFLHLSFSTVQTPPPSCLHLRRNVVRRSSPSPPPETPRSRQQSPAPKKQGVSLSILFFLCIFSLFRSVFVLDPDCLFWFALETSRLKKGVNRRLRFEARKNLKSEMKNYQKIKAAIDEVQYLIDIKYGEKGPPGWIGADPKAPDNSREVEDKRKHLEKLERQKSDSEKKIALYEYRIEFGMSPPPKPKKHRKWTVLVFVGFTDQGKKKNIEAYFFCLCCCCCWTS